MCGYDRVMRIRDADDEEWQDDDEPLDEPPPFDPVLGPDDRDQDLIDGTWEERYYSGRAHQRDWTNVFVGVGIIVVVSMLLPMILVLTR